MAIQNFLSEQINSVFDDCCGIRIYKNGKVKEIKKDTQEFSKILQMWQITINGGIEMPAFGVSLHGLTLQDLKEGLHIEFLFDKTLYHNEMPFDSLLIKLQDSQGGYQLIRHCDDKYQGRCFYINTFDIDDSFYNFINSI